MLLLKHISNTQSLSHFCSHIFLTAFIDSTGKAIYFNIFATIIINLLFYWQRFILQTYHHIRQEIVRIRRIVIIVQIIIPIGGRKLFQQMKCILIVGLLHCIRGVFLIISLCLTTCCCFRFAIGHEKTCSGNNAKLCKGLHCRVWMEWQTNFRPSRLWLSGFSARFWSNY